VSAYLPIHTVRHSIDDVDDELEYSTTSDTEARQTGRSIYLSDCQSAQLARTHGANVLQARSDVTLHSL